MGNCVFSRGTCAIALAALVAATAHAQTTLYTFNGDSSGDVFGNSVSGAGDVNADGFADLIVGALFDDNNGTSSGSARVFSGFDGSVLYTFDGDSADDEFGNSVSGAGDVNGDGFADLIVGAHLDAPNGTFSGSARVFSGFDGSILYTFNGGSEGDRFGSSVSGAGDVDGDGFDDLIVGAIFETGTFFNSGSARVFSGFDGSVLYEFYGASAGRRFGFSVSGAGDVDGDGFADLIVGESKDFADGKFGSARVFSGFDGSVLYTFTADTHDDWFGHSVSGAGDVDGDGFDDLIVGAWSDDTNSLDSGHARVFSGFDGSILYTFNGDSADDRLGWSVSGAGDVDGDGFADLIVGAFKDDNNGIDSGSARVFSGIDGTILYTFDGDSFDFFGHSVSGAGDVDGDGFADLIAGAHFDDNNGSNSGSARVISGRTEVLPNGFLVVRGVLTGGGLSDLLISDDLRLDVRAGLTLFLGESPLQIAITGTSPVEVPSELRFKLEASANTPGLTQTIELFNYDTSAYEQVDFTVPGFMDTMVEVVITTNPGRFVQAGTREMRAKVSYQQVGLTLLWPWSARLDQTVWTIVP